jgi:hypothetical protein
LVVVEQVVENYSQPNQAIAISPHPSASSASTSDMPMEQQIREGPHNGMTFTVLRAVEVDGLGGDCKEDQDAPFPSTIPQRSIIAPSSIEYSRRLTASGRGAVMQVLPVSLIGAADVGFCQ